MALSRKKATTIALDPQDDWLLSRAARERGVSFGVYPAAPRPRARAVPPPSQAEKCGHPSARWPSPATKGELFGGGR